jgi:multidrug resistance efflux pump
MFFPDKVQQLEARIEVFERQNINLKAKVAELAAALGTKKSNAVAPRNENNQADVYQRLSCRRV